jgi:hypothetical protein
VKYCLFVLVEEKWIRVAEFEARNNADAYLQISKILPVEHRGTAGVSIQGMNPVRQTVPPVPVN